MGDEGGGEVPLRRHALEVVDVEQRDLDHDDQDDYNYLLYRVLSEDLADLALFAHRIPLALSLRQRLHLLHARPRPLQRHRRKLQSLFNVLLLDGVIFDLVALQVAASVDLFASDALPADQVVSGGLFVVGQVVVLVAALLPHPAVLLLQDRQLVLLAQLLRPLRGLVQLSHPRQPKYLDHPHRPCRDPRGLALGDKAGDLEGGRSVEHGIGDEIDVEEDGYG